MRLWALSDVHAGFEANRRAVEAMSDHGDDWLILAGDTGDTLAQLEFVLDVLTRRFAKVIWTPGNHDLWTPRQWPDVRRGVAHYERLVEACRRRGVLTPEDPFALWPATGHVIAPTFTLYDYSFGPRGLSEAQAVAWAAETRVQCADQLLLSPAPYASRSEWCAERVSQTEARLDALPADSRLILANHYPLRADLAVLPRIPRFAIWCGTSRTNDWHTRYRADVVISGHLHLRSTRWRAGVRFEEVSLGYPPQWQQARAIDDYLRPILPEPTGVAGWGLDATTLRHW